VKAVIRPRHIEIGARVCPGFVSLNSTVTFIRYTRIQSIQAVHIHIAVWHLLSPYDTIDTRPMGFRKQIPANCLQLDTPKELNENFVRVKLQEWLRFPSINDRRAAVTTAHRDTFRWVLSLAPSMNTRTSGADFVKWLRDGSGVYWIQGKMGCGKSTLMKYVSENKMTEKHLLEWADGQTLHCPSYYFSKAGTSELQQSLQGLYRNLLATLIQHEKGLLRVAFPDWQASDSNHKPTSAVLRDALEKILTSSDITCKYCFFIDGLDEYWETDNGLRGELAEDILRLARLPAVKLVVASRPESVFALRFAHCPTMELHRLTERDIAAYVDTEIRRKSLPRVLTAIDTRQLRLLCNGVTRKAEGVFLWVTIAVASVLNGIADYETLPELSSRLKRLDPRLSVLFKQVLTERIQASHRKQVARCLLAANLIKRRVTFFQNLDPDIHAVVQATIPHVDASHDYTTLLGNGNEIWTHIAGLQRSLPGRSCGLYLEPETWSPDMRPTLFLLRPLHLSHSSLIEFLDEHETQAILLEEAGDDFQVNEAIAVGRMAHLVLNMEMVPTYMAHYSTLDLLDILRNIGKAGISRGVKQTSLISTFDNMLCLYPERSLELANALKRDTDWDPLYEDHIRDPAPSRLATLYSDFPLLRPRGVSCHGSDVLSLSIVFGLSCYLEFKTNACRGLPQKIGTPLLFYPLWTGANLKVWWMEKADPSVNEDRNTSISGIYDEKCHVTPVKLLLAQGADPNECCHGLTPWSVLLQRICSGRDFDVPPPGWKNAANWPKESFERSRVALEVAKLMLDHGADPFYSMESPRCTISPQIFAELLGREHCSGYSLHNCHCVYARQLQPQLTELVDLVEERRYLKLQTRTDGELLLIGAWLVVVSAYILQICFT
jgi:hypothetical protein